MNSAVNCTSLREFDTSVICHVFTVLAVNMVLTCILYRDAGPGFLTNCLHARCVVS